MGTKATQECAGMAGAGGCGGRGVTTPPKLPSFPSRIDDAARGFVAALDRNGDGLLRISTTPGDETIHASSIDLTAFVRVADADGDGAASADELAAVLRRYHGATSSCPHSGATPVTGGGGQAPPSKILIIGGDKLPGMTPEAPAAAA